MIKLFRFLKPWSAQIAAVLILIFCQVMAELFLPTLMADIINDGIMKGDIGYIAGIGGTMLGVTFISLACALASSWLSSLAGTGMGHAIRAAVFRRVMGFTLQEFDKFGTALLIKRTTNDIAQVQDVTLMTLRVMVMAPMMAIGGIVLASAKDGPLTLVLAVAVPIPALLVGLVFSRAMPLFKSIQKKVDRLNLVMREGLTGIRVIRAFNRTIREEERFEAANADITGTTIKVNRIMAFMMPAMMLTMNLSSLAILWFGVVRIDSGGMALGNLIAFTQYAMLILFSFLILSMMLAMVPRAQAAAERINQVLAELPEIADPKIPVQPSGSRGDVEFRHVSFSYRGAEQPALEDVSFHARAGETTAIIGSTGSGKSTLAKLIARFYDVDTGQVLVDGVDVREMAQAGLRRRLGYVPQKTVLFSGSVRDNLGFGSGGVDDARLREAAEIAQASGFIAAMAEGLDHHISPGGATVSGDQKQRLSIARALARPAGIFIFDDSFSTLDFETAARLQAALRVKIRSATVLLIAQRIGTVMDADRIIVLDDGRVVGIGKHAELLVQCPVYREIAASQLAAEARA